MRCLGKKTLTRCRNNEKPDVILIDVDSENFDNVIIIDSPKTLPKKNQGPSLWRKDKNVIIIDVNDDDDEDDDDDDDGGDDNDDDEDDDGDNDETHDSCHCAGVNDASFSAGTSSGEKSFPVAQNFEEPADAAVEDSQFVQDNATPVRLSKCKRTYSGKSFGSNRYALDIDSEGDLSDNDYPDCELVEDSSGKVQKLWEMAFSRRRKDVHSGHSGIKDHDSTSHCINKDYHKNVESKDGTRQHKIPSFCSTSGKSNNENDDSSPFRTEGDTDIGYTHLFDDAIHDQQYNKSGVHDRSNSQAKCCPSIHIEQADCLDTEPGCSRSHIEERRKCPTSSKFASQEKSTNKFGHPIPIVEDKETSEVGLCPPQFDPFAHKDSCNGKSSPIECEATMHKSKSSFEGEINQGRFFPGDNHKNDEEMATGSVEERDHLGSHATEGAEEIDILMPERCSFERSTLSGKQTDFCSTPSCSAVDVHGKFLFSESSLSSGEGKKSNHKETRPLVPVIPLFGSIHLNKAKLQEDNSLSNIKQQETKDGLLHSQNEVALSPVETCIINDREKLKETDEYKRAMEEEWASRQQALLIQAEEARCLRRLRKRRKAESMRLEDMERRQKERLEEIRNTQKKDEENMSLKETIRCEVRNELKKLEIECKNMASLLHVLEIRVGSWPNPSPQEVQTAYKRALLTFHPDRAPQASIRQQVEAEEKFKLITRLKEKFPLK